MHMELSQFLTLKAVLSLGFGIALVLAPASLLSMYGVSLDPVGGYLARLLGVDLIAIGFVCWAAQGAVENQLVPRLILALFAADAIGSVVIVWGQLAGVLNALGWVNVVIWLFLTLGLGYFRFLRPSV
jgi:hypothetical protein